MLKDTLINLSIIKGVRFLKEYPKVWIVSPRPLFNPAEKMKQAQDSTSS